MLGNIQKYWNDMVKSNNLSLKGMVWGFIEKGRTYLYSIQKMI